MKHIVALLIGGVLVSASAAELSIQSLSRNGELSWTNSVSNATYRVEWAGSLAGPWQEFTALTNLSSIVASNSTVTVIVPMFYRVVWTDPPAPRPVGNWLFNGYDFAGSLVVTGLVSISADYETNGPSSNWMFASVPDGTNSFYLDCSVGDISTSLTGFQFSAFLRGCDLAEGAFWLDGILVDGLYSGTWFSTGVGLNPIGSFIARRQSK